MTPKCPKCGSRHTEVQRQVRVHIHTATHCIQQVARARCHNCHNAWNQMGRGRALSRCPGLRP